MNPDRSGYGFSLEERTSREVQLRFAKRASPFPSPRPYPSGRGRIVRRLAASSGRQDQSQRRDGQSRLESSESGGDCSLSLKERARVRGNRTLLLVRRRNIPETVELCRKTMNVRALARGIK